MERLHPGVYVEEISSGVRPIEAVGTSTAAFLGVAARGVPEQAELVTSFDEFRRWFGGHRPGADGHLSLAAEAFFEAGGRRAYAVRVMPDDAEPARQEAPQPTRFTATGTLAPALQLRACGAGSWADYLRVRISDATNFSDEAFRIEVLWTESGATRTLERFDDLRMDPAHEDYFAPIVNERSRYICVTDEFARANDENDGTLTPVPAQVPRLQARPLSGGDDSYVVHEGATLAFTWSDGVESRSQRVTFEGGGLTFNANGTATLSRAQLRVFLDTAFTGHQGGAIFRVTQGSGNAGPFVEPNVATRGRLTIAAPTGDAYNLSGETLEITIAGETTSIVIDDESDIADASAVTPAALAAVLARRLGANNAVDRVGGEIIIRTRPSGDADAGVRTPGLAQTPGTNNLDVTATAGIAGIVVESLDGVTITVSEEPNRHFPRTLRDLALPSRARGYEQNSPANPVVRPRNTTDPIRLVGGYDGTGTPGVDDYERALASLDRLDVNILALPGQNSVAYINAGLSYCDRRGDCFFVADGPGHVDESLDPVGPSDARDFILGLPNRSNNGAMFYPWLEIPDPVGAGRNPRRFVPPSGHVAGIFARTDINRGVWKAPAGIEAVASGVIGLQYQVIDAEQDLLNPVGLNAVRQFPGLGIVSWGSRTLSSDPEWRYIPVRRTALFLKTSLQRGLQWAVFEPNDAELWGRIRVNITSFMLSLFRQKAFQGSTPDEAFTVTCDRSTNPQELVDQGIVTARVAFAPLKPAEFVVIEIVQKTLVGT